MNNYCGLVLSISDWTRLERAVLAEVSLWVSEKLSPVSRQAASRGSRGTRPTEKYCESLRAQRIVNIEEKGHGLTSNTAPPHNGNPPLPRN